jgi:hypothetical protein
VAVQGKRAVAVQGKRVAAVQGSACSVRRQAGSGLTECLRKLAGREERRPHHRGTTAGKDIMDTLPSAVAPPARRTHRGRD